MFLVFGLLEWHVMICFSHESNTGGWPAFHYWPEDVTEIIKPHSRSLIISHIPHCFIYAINMGQMISWHIPLLVFFLCCSACGSIFPSDSNRGNPSHRSNLAASYNKTKIFISLNLLESFWSTCLLSTQEELSSNQKVWDENSHGSKIRMFTFKPEQMCFTLEFRNANRIGQIRMLQQTIRSLCKHIANKVCITGRG